MPEFGATIRKIREQLRKTLASVAADMGVSVVYLSDIERGRRSPPLGEKLQKLSASLQLNPQEVEEWAHKERQRVELNLNNRTEVASNAAIMLARRWDSLSDDEASQILKILNREKNNDK